MNDLEISFEESPWEIWLQGVQPGDTVSCVQLLAMMEGEEEQEIEDVLQALEGKVDLDISGLPKSFGAGDTAVRLRREDTLVKKGLDAAQLEENDPLAVYLKDIAQTPACGDEVLLAQEAAAGKGSAQEMLTNLGLSRVVELAKEYTGYGVLLLDLIQEGSLGLWQAVVSYEAGDYASHRDRHIRFALARAITLQARASGTGEKLRTAMEDYRAVDERLLSDLGRNPTLEEIAVELHTSVEEAETVRKVLDDARILAKVKRVPDEEEEKQAEEQAVEDTAQFQSRQRILDLLSGVTEEENKLLTLRFGLEGGKPLTPEEVGRKLGLSPEEVVAKEAAALAKLRKG